MILFCEFIDKKQRDQRKHLKLVESLLKKNGIECKPHLENEDPYIFVKSTKPKLSFDGIRIYEIGNVLAYRVVKEEKTEPYGKAYSLDLEEMFNDFMSEDMKEEQAGKKVIESVLNEIKKFFDRSLVAEEDLKKNDLNGDGTIMLRTGGSDYSSQIFNKS